MPASDLTILVAIGAGLISFLSPCVLPLVPAYLGQLTAAATVGRDASRGREAPSRWLAVRHAVAYVLGFGLVFTILGVTATYVGGPLFDALPGLRIVGGVVVILLGLNLAGLLPVPLLYRTWRPLQAGATAARAEATGGIAIVPAAGSAGRSAAVSGFGTRLGGALVGTRWGWLTSFGLGVVFAVGWTPCIGVVLGAILTVAATSGTALSGAILLAAYSIGLGLPFLALGLVYDRVPAVVRPLTRHGLLVSRVGGALVMVIGVALAMDWLSVLARMSPGV